MLLDNHFAPDRRVLREAQLLSDAGVNVTIIAWDRRPTSSGRVPDLPQRVKLERVHVPAPPGGGWRTLLSLLRFASRAWSRFGVLLQDADLLVAHDIYLLPLATVLSRRWNIPLVYDAHEDFAMMEGGRLPGLLLRATTRVESALAKRAVLVVVPGQVRRQRWTEVGFAPPVILANTGIPSAEAPIAEHEDLVWDLVYCGLLDASRRPDLLVELARQRPDLRVGVAGSGRAAESVRAAAMSQGNLDFIGWVDDPAAILRRSRAIYYGLDPSNPYSDGACPNNVSQAIRARRPLIFFCGGEAAEMSERFRVGLRVAANVPALEAAVDAVITDTEPWDFEGAARAIAAADSGAEYVAALVGAMELA